jgi:TPR repeat protein
MAYQQGNGVKLDLDEATRWYRTAAVQGAGAAQNALLICYLRGWDVEADLGEAAFWFRKAADQSFVTAERRFCQLFGSSDVESSVPPIWLQFLALINGLTSTETSRH